MVRMMIVMVLLMITHLVLQAICASLGDVYKTNKHRLHRHRNVLLEKQSPVIRDLREQFLLVPVNMAIITVEMENGVGVKAKYTRKQKFAMVLMIAVMASLITGHLALLDVHA